MAFLPDEIVVILILALIVVGFLAIRYYVRSEYYRKKKEEVEGQKRSQSTLYGKISEQFAPFMERYPFDSQRFRFIGTPIDGIQFEDDKVVFVEIKSAKSNLSPIQRQIKQLVKAGKVDWYEFDIRVDSGERV